MDHSLEEANQINADSRQLFDDYQKMIQDDFNELLKIDASQYMINNTELKSYQAKMVNLSDKMADKLEEFKARYDTSKMLYESNDAEMAITDLKQSSKELQQIMDEMQDVHKKTANILLNMINERQKVYQQEQEKKALKKAKQKASPTEGEEVESSAENDDSAETATETQEPMITEPVNETPAETTVPEAETPEQISETAPTEVNVIRTKYDTQPANQTPAATSGKRPLLVEITDENEPSNKKVSGSITKSYEEVAEPLQNQSTGLLKESGGYNQKVSGKITVK